MGDEAKKVENDLIARGLTAAAEKMAHMGEDLENPETRGADLVADAKAAHDELAAAVKESNPSRAGS